MCVSANTYKKRLANAHVCLYSLSINTRMRHIIIIMCCLYNINVLFIIFMRCWSSRWKQTHEITYNFFLAIIIHTLSGERKKRKQTKKKKNAECFTFAHLQFARFLCSLPMRCMWILCVRSLPLPLLLPFLILFQFVLSLSLLPILILSTFNSYGKFCNSHGVLANFFLSDFI